MWSTLKSYQSLAWRNRGKLALALVIAIGVAAYSKYNSSQEESAELSELTIPVPTTSNKNSKNKKSKLFRIRKQYDILSFQFLKTLREKMIETIDIQSIIKQIKEIRMLNNVDNELEDKLWEDIKVGSFSQLFISVYSASSLCVLLKVQMHLISGYSESFPRNPDESTQEIQNQSVSLSGLHADTDVDDGQQCHDIESFKKLVDGTFKHLFGTGLRTITSIIREQITIQLKDWTVKEKLAVDYNELLQMLSSVRRHIESDMPNLIRLIIMPPESFSNTVIQSECGDNDRNDLNKAVMDTQLILSQIWDVVESPMFIEAFTEVVDSCFHIIIDQLRSNIFLFENNGRSEISNGWSPAMRSPPLASLLPLVKSIALLFFPSDRLNTINSVEQVNMRNVLNGPILDSLCIALFEADSSK